jgi:hypothetical protein
LLIIEAKTKPVVLALSMTVLGRWRSMMNGAMGAAISEEVTLRCFALGLEKVVGANGWIFYFLFCFRSLLFVLPFNLFYHNLSAV